LPIIHRGASVRVDFTTAGRDASHHPFQVGTESGRGFCDGFPNIHVPKVIQGDWHVDPDTRQPNKIVRGNNPEPTAGHYQPTPAIDIKAVGSFQTLAAAS